MQRCLMLLLLVIDARQRCHRHHYHSIRDRIRASEMREKKERWSGQWQQQHQKPTILVGNEGEWEFKVLVDGNDNDDGERGSCLNEILLLFVVAVIAVVCISRWSGWFSGYRMGKRARERICVTLYSSSPSLSYSFLLTSKVQNL